MDPSVSYRQKSIGSRLRSLLRGNEEGGALVEMAVTLPLVLMLMTGIFSFSVALYQKLQLAEAVSVGGRYLATAAGATDPCSQAAAAIVAGAPALTPGQITLQFNLNGVITGPAKANVISCSNGTTPNPNLVEGQNAQVIASYPCSLTIFGASFTSCTLATQLTEVVQ